MALEQVPGEVGEVLEPGDVSGEPPEAVVDRAVGVDDKCPVARLEKQQLTSGLLEDRLRECCTLWRGL